MTMLSFPAKSSSSSSSVSALTEASVPMLLKPLFDDGFTGGKLPVWLVPAVIVGLFALRGVAYFGSQWALVRIANEVEERLRGCKKNIKVAVMGCVVNGPGEAKEADIGIAGGDGCGLVFKKGEVIRKVSEEELVDALMDEIAKL